MLKNYFKFALRTLAGNKLYSGINIIGLSVGLTVALLIGLWIRDEYSYDRYNANYDRIARVMQHGRLDGNTYTTYSMPIPLGNELRTTYGHYFKQVVLSYWLRDHVLAFQDKKLTEKGKFMEEAAPDMLALKMIRGSRNGLKDPGSILLASSVAKAIFGEADPMGKAMIVDNKMNVTVTGVYEDLPDNSFFRNTLFIAPWDLLAANDPDVKDNRTAWAWDATELYVQLADGVDINKASAAIRNSTYVHLKGPSETSYKPQVFLFPMDRWHLYSAFKEGINRGGAIQFVWLFGTIGLLVLLLACINFMNLSTARSERRAREIGVRKAIGSLKGQLILQFFCESMVAAGFALLIAVVFIYLALPLFNQLSGKLMAQPWGQPWFWLTALGFCLFTGLIAGTYPAFYLSSFQPVKVLKGTFKAGPLAAIPRKVLVVLQCSVSILLIVGTLIVYRQVQFAKDRPVGYIREGLLTVQMTTPDLWKQREVMRNELLRTGAVAEVAISSSPATGVWQGLTGFDWPGKDPSTQGEFGAISVSPEYGKTIGWQFMEGRDFSREYATDSSGLILNEAAVKFMGLRNPVGEKINWNGQPFKVLGVVKNMVMGSPYEPANQTIYFLSKDNDAHFMLFRVKPTAAMGEALSAIQHVFQRLAPAVPFDYKFVDQEYAKKFVAEEQVGKLTGLFSLLAIFISCLGIFGMASFMAEQRIKEIGIRKVLGASVLGLWNLLSKDFVLLVVIASLIAMPLAYYIMSHWLQNYQYRTGMDWWIFAAAGLGAVLITLVTVSFQAIKAALANPIKSLRVE
ncbi:MAG TPA: ABC transporter permease [Puia sp.]|nr:ABC transporter permease [Puia sp.]